MLSTKKRGKKHDKDRYYNLAREQGYRARSAFKLIQVNQEYDILSRARVCIDLCAAPGGWCQVASKTMPPNSTVIGIDLIPIRPIPNVTTYVSDITTPECRAILKRQLGAQKADVVLCDGAPNVGSDYSKDAFVQNELSLSALRLATQFLARGGSFLTKVYRSRDYNSFLWALRHFFPVVHTIKPDASRTQSAEIFVLAMHYNDPDKIDPRMLDPNHVFAEIQGGTEEGAQVSVFHKKFDQLNKRKRGGYDESLGITLRNVMSVLQFVRSEDPAMALTQATEISMDVPAGQSLTEGEQLLMNIAEEVTDIDTRESMRDLRILSKSELRKLMRWRLILLKKFNKQKGELTLASAQEEQEQAMVESDSDDGGDDDDEEDEEEEMDEEEKQMKSFLSRKQKERELRLKKQKKKKRVQRLKLLAFAQNSAFEDEGEVDLFSRSDVDFLRDHEDDDDIYGEAMFIPHPDELDNEDYETEDLERAWRERGGDKVDGFEERKQPPPLPKGLKNAPQHLKSLEDEEEAKFSEAYLASLVNVASKKKQKRKRDDDDDDDDDSDDDSDDDDSDMEGEERVDVIDGQLVRDAELGLDGEEDEDEERWFSHPMFASQRSGRGEEEAVSRSKEAEEEAFLARVESMIPKTDKEKRRIKRRKEKARQERREAKRRRKGDEGDEEDIKILEAFGEDSDDEQATRGGREARKRRERERREEERLKERAGTNRKIGQALRNTRLTEEEEEEEQKQGIQIVSSSSSSSVNHDGEGEGVPRFDDRDFGDMADLDVDEKVRALAIAYMLRKRKIDVDDYYNRYMFNDASSLPSWFVQDQEQHHRPHVEVNPNLEAKIREKYFELAHLPIKKATEAKLRKKKRLIGKLKAAKKKAGELSDNSKLSHFEKLRELKSYLKHGLYKMDEKQRRGLKVGTKADNRPEKGKKMVDKRMKADMKKSTKKLLKKRKKVRHVKRRK